MNHRKHITLFLIVILICGAGGMGILFFSKISRKNPVSIKNIDIDSKAVMKLSQLEQVSKKNGITEWELNADTATLLSEKDQAILQNVRVIFYTKDQQKITLTAQKGVLYTQAKDMDFSDNVILTYGDYVMNTDRLHYKKKLHIIQSDAPIQLKNKDSKIVSDQMKLYLKTGVLVFDGHVKGWFSDTFKLPQN